MPTEVEIDCGFDSLDQQVADAISDMCEKVRVAMSNGFALYGQDTTIVLTMIRVTISDKGVQVDAATESSR